MIIQGTQEVIVKLVELPKIPQVVGHKFFKKVEDIMRFGEVKVEYCGTTVYSWMQGQTTMWLVGKLTSPSIRRQGGELLYLP